MSLPESDPKKQNKSMGVKSWAFALLGELQRFPQQFESQRRSFSCDM